MQARNPLCKILQASPMETKPKLGMPFIPSPNHAKPGERQESKFGAQHFLGRPPLQQKKDNKMERKINTHTHTHKTKKKTESETTLTNLEPQIRNPRDPWRPRGPGQLRADRRIRSRRSRREGPCGQQTVKDSRLVWGLGFRV